MVTGFLEAFLRGIYLGKGVKGAGFMKRFLKCAVKASSWSLFCALGGGSGVGSRMRRGFFQGVSCYFGIIIRDCSRCWCSKVL